MLFLTWQGKHRHLFMAGCHIEPLSPLPCPNPVPPASLEINILYTSPGITADVCSARELIAPARAASGLRNLEGAAKTLGEELNQTR